MTRVWRFLLALLVCVFASGVPPALSRPVTEREVDDAIARVDVLDDERWIAAADSLLRPLWLRAVADSSRRPGPAGRLTARRARLLSGAWLSGVRPPNGWTREQSLDWLSVALRWMRAAYGQDSRRLVTPLRAQADLARDMERYRLADSLGRAAVALSRRLEPPRERSIVASLVSLAATQGRVGDYRASIASIDTAIALLESLPEPSRDDTLDLAVAHNGRASAELMLRDDALAERDLLRCLDLRERVGAQPADLAQVVSNLGIIAYRRGDAAKAVELYTRAAELYPQEPQVNWRGLGWTLAGLASSEELLGRPAEALRHQRRAVEILEREWGKEHRLVGRQYLALASFQRELGDAPGAMASLEHAMSLFDRPGAESPSFLIQFEADRAQLLRMQGRTSAAESVVVRTLARSDSLFGLTASWRHRLVLELAETRLARGDSAGALVAFRERHAVAASISGHESPLVLEYAWRVVSWPDSTGGPSLEGSRELLATAERVGVESLLPWTHDLVARAGLTHGVPPDAFVHALEAERGFRARFELAARGFTSHEAIAFERTRPRPLDAAWHAYDVRRQRGELLPGGVRAGARELWDEVVRSRARVFDELAARRRVSALADDSTRAALEELQRASTALAALALEGSADTTAARRAKLRAARERQADAERALAAASEAFRADESGAHAGFADVERSLAPSQALVSFARFGGATPGARAEYVAFVRGVAGEVVALGLGDAEAIDSLLARWRADLSPRAARRGSAAWRTSGAALRRRVWDPIAPHLAGAAEAWIVPDGALDALPWNALPTGTRGTLLDAPLLLRRVASERDLVSAATSPSGRGLLALGGAEFAGTAAAARADSLPAACDALRGPFAPLPGTLAEVADVAARWRASVPGEEPLVLSGTEASEREFRERAPGRRVLHVATHAFRLDDGCDASGRATPGGTRGIGGLASNATPTPARARARAPRPTLGADALLRTGLLFAGAEQATARPAGDDGVLSAEEIAALDLRGVELAVLSACGTSLGEALAGEGTLGLERAFRIAGSRATLGALWPVDDAATLAWMRAFYAAGGGMGGDATTAARAAARKLRGGERAHPFWWAAFAVTSGAR